MGVLPTWLIQLSYVDKPIRKNRVSAQIYYFISVTGMTKVVVMPLFHQGISDSLLITFLPFGGLTHHTCKLFCQARSLPKQPQIMPLPKVKSMSIFGVWQRCIFFLCLQSMFIFPTLQTWKTHVKPFKKCD